MDVIDETIETLGRSMKIDNLRFNQHNVVFLDIDQMGALLIERSQDRLLVYLATTLLPYQKEAYAKALQLCHFQEGLPMDVSVGYQEPDRLIMTIRMPMTEVNTDRLNQAIKLLFYLYGAVSES